MPIPELSDGFIPQLRNDSSCQETMQWSILKKKKKKRAYSGLESHVLSYCFPLWLCICTAVCATNSTHIAFRGFNSAKLLLSYKHRNWLIITLWRKNNHSNEEEEILLSSLSTSGKPTRLAFHYLLEGWIVNWERGTFGVSDFVVLVSKENNPQWNIPFITKI